MDNILNRCIDILNKCIDRLKRCINRLYVDRMMVL